MSIKINSIVIAAGLVFSVFSPVHASEAAGYNHIKNNKDKMIFASEIIRHGDRTPYRKLPTAPYVWPEGLGQLTPLGMQQEYLLGKEMHERYIEQAQLLSEHYQPGQIYVRSSAVDRTIMSAQSLLLGLYPLGSGPKLKNGEYALPSGYQPIPIHSVDSKKDDLLLGRAVKRTEFNQLVDQYVAPSTSWQEQLVILEPKMDAWRKALNLPIKRPYDLPGLGDNLYVRTVHQVAIPKQLTQQQREEIIHYGHKILAQQYKPKAIGALTGKKLLIAERDNLQRAITGKSAVKFILYSAHDISILAFMSAIGAPLDIAPPYASHLSLQLFQTKDGQYYFTVALNNQPMSIPGCQMSNHCTMNQLNAIIENLSGYNTSSSVQR